MNFIDKMDFLLTYKEGNLQSIWWVSDDFTCKLNLSDGTSISLQFDTVMQYNTAIYLYRWHNS